jgi:hypothetical protein
LDALVMTRAWVLLIACAVGCGAASHRATTAMPAPRARAPRQAAIDAFGRRAWEALSDGEPQRLVFDELELRALVDTAGATRLTARRESLHRRLGDNTDLPTSMAGARYAGICLQGARDEQRGGVLGLRADGWLIDRALVIGTRPGGRRIASWLEGPFLFTDAGFGALDLESVESPRWEHSDLELAPCDFAIRNDLPEEAR